MIHQGYVNLLGYNKIRTLMSARNIQRSYIGSVFNLCGQWYLRMVGFVCSMRWRDIKRHAWYHVMSGSSNPTMSGTSDLASYLKQMASVISDMVTLETDLLQLTQLVLVFGWKWPCFALLFLEINGQSKERTLHIERNCNLTWKLHDMEAL